MKTIEMKFRGESVQAKFAKYTQGGRTAIELIQMDDEYPGLPIPYAVATVNLPDEPLGEDEVLIKNWSENEGMTRALVEAGIVAEPHGQVQTGFCVADKCKLLIKPE